MNHEASVEKFKSQLELINLSLDELREERKELKSAAWNCDIREAMDRIIKAKSYEITNNAIRERLNSPNLSMDDLIATRAFALVAGGSPDVIDELNEAIKSIQGKEK